MLEFSSLAEFKNNTPSIAEYELEKEPGLPINVYLKDSDGKPYLSRKFWGLSDGKSLFVMMGRNLYSAIRSCHSYYIYGSQVYFVKRNNTAKFLLLSPATAESLFPGKASSLQKTASLQLIWKRARYFRAALAISFYNTFTSMMCRAYSANMLLCILPRAIALG